MEIAYEERGFKTIIKRWQVIGPKLNGLRNGKPFIHNGDLFVNYEGNLCRVTIAKFTDSEGKETDQSSVPLDTDTAVRGVIVTKKEIILLHRIKMEREYYIFPGGHQMVNESDRAALTREILEETGLDISMAEKKLLFVSRKKNAGPEKFYLITGKIDFSNMIKTNPDQLENEINEIMKVDFKAFSNLHNVFPEEVFNIVNNSYCK